MSEKREGNGMKCSAWSREIGGEFPCGKTAVVKFEGAHYCAEHDPRPALRKVQLFAARESVIAAVKAWKRVEDTYATAGTLSDAASKIYEAARRLEEIEERALGEATDKQ